MTEEPNAKENYNCEAKCKNCKKVNYFNIPKGTTLKEYLESNKTKCEKCDCLMYE